MSTKKKPSPGSIVREIRRKIRTTPAVTTRLSDNMLSSNLIVTKETGKQDFGLLKSAVHYSIIKFART